MSQDELRAFIKTLQTMQASFRRIARDPNGALGAGDANRLVADTLGDVIRLAAAKLRCPICDRPAEPNDPSVGWCSNPFHEPLR